METIGNDTDNIITASSGGSEIIGGHGKDILHGGKGNDIFVYSEGDGHDTIYDYTPGKDKIKLTSGSITSASLSGSDVILKIGTGSTKVKNAKDKKITVIDKDGNETSEVYPIKNPLPSGWKYANTAKTSITATLTSAANIDLTKTYGTNVEKVDGTKITKAVKIVGNTKANSIKGGSSKDTINGGKGNDTLYGNSGNDSLVGGDGADKLYGGNDNDVLKGDAGNDSLYGGEGNDKLYGDAGNDKLYGDAGNDTISGGAGNDSLLGGAGNDSLNGGSGNDTLTGGAGNDIFTYEGGKDVITDYTAGQDKIKISGKISKTTYKNKDVIFTIGNGSLTVKNAKGKNISVTDSSNKTQTYSKTFDLLYDNNFVTDELQIDDVSQVSESNYSVGQFYQSSNFQTVETVSITSAITFEKK